MSTKELTNEKQTISVSEIAITGVCIALTFIATGFINIRLPIAANGYYIAEGIIYGNWIAPAASIPGNLVQIGVAAVLVLPIAEVVRRAIRR